MTAADLSLRARAKINLALHVTGRRADGYHLLDSLVVFAEIGDSLEVRPAEHWSLSVTGPMADRCPAGDDNLVIRAARATDGPPAAFTLDKHLPIEAGIGGGTADAAAALHALRNMDGRALPADPVRLGADLPVCLLSRAARVEGVGEIVKPVDGLPPIHAVLVNPRVAVSTPTIFNALTRRENAPLPPFPAWPDARALADWLGDQRNDLEDPARSVCPAVGVALARIARTESCLLARMSGSGATCFGLYASAPEAQMAAAKLTKEHPNWWIRATGLA
ncbi:4-(cytidine 5'-diphospho)-2-C-methyl-D-erythritol kinase [Palleronia sp. LCG004]|uniref:4-(cytidine 5'-diphospho)-2-C-methyl-D-erythritol kinase n=1 Tax=Palleronia sp. LCG004 TaxID=3079304 RepID=UPI002943E84C|nr:4-(cytidine 5'-diphospho)-2-C-methyl-D-erythritol kinase [Palleronia sp. LCG004]WOI56374.1 4-(cytidine 5'-diphospho)-2-C-methyl-D-erythritol kinase [Palleronia sp. LCG004]